MQAGCVNDHRAAGVRLLVVPLRHCLRYSLFSGDRLAAVVLIDIDVILKWITVIHIAESILERKGCLIHCAGMSRTDPQVKIRLPRPLKIKVEASAQANGRTLNGEIVHLIQQAMGDAPGIIRGTSADIHARLDELTAKVKKLEKRGA
jgi:hypothetical protein